MEENKYTTTYITVKNRRVTVMTKTETPEEHHKKTIAQYPALVLIQKVGKRRAISFLFFSTVFLLSTSQYMKLFQFNAVELASVYIYSFFLYTISVICLFRSLEQVRAMFVGPLTVILGTLIIFYIILLSALSSSFMFIPAGQHPLFLWHSFLFFVTLLVICIIYRSLETICHAVMNIWQIQMGLDLKERRASLMAINKYWNLHYANAQRKSPHRVRFHVISTDIY